MNKKSSTYRRRRLSGGKKHSHTHRRKRSLSRNRSFSGGGCPFNRNALNVSGGGPFDSMRSDPSPNVSKLGNQMSELVQNIRRKLNLRNFGTTDTTQTAPTRYTFDDNEEEESPSGDLFGSSGDQDQDSPTFETFDQLGGKRGPGFGNYYRNALKKWRRSVQKRRSNF